MNPFCATNGRILGNTLELPSSATPPIHSSIVSGRRKEGRTTKKQSLSGVSMNGLCSSFRCTLRNKKFLISFSGSLDRGLLYAKVGPTEVYYFVACRFQ